MDTTQASEDLKYIRTMIERTQKQIDPQAPLAILWGMVSLSGGIGTHFLSAGRHDEQIAYLWLILVFLIGFPIDFFLGYRASRREKTAGIKSYVSRQLSFIWAFLTPNGLLWTFIGPAADIFPAESIPFLWAALYAIGLGMMGILYSREWLYAGIGVSAGILLAGGVAPYRYAIIGIATGLGCIIPGIVAQRRFLKRLKEDETSFGKSEQAG